jgi:hypothetical protein
VLGPLHEFERSAQVSTVPAGHHAHEAKRIVVKLRTIQSPLGSVGNPTHQLGRIVDLYGLRAHVRHALIVATDG